MDSNLIIVTPPAASLLAPTDLYDQLRIVNDDAQDALIQDYIDAAEEYIQLQTQHVFQPIQFLYVLNRFPYMGVDGYRPFTAPTNGIITLPRSPLLTVDSFTYVDTNVVLQTMTSADYQLDNLKRPPKLWPKRFSYWPITDPLTPSAVQITFTAGYSDPAQYPKRAKQAIRFLVTHWYVNRIPIGEAKNEIPKTLSSLIRSLKVTGYVTGP